MSEPVIASKLANALFAEAQTRIVDTHGAIEGAIEQQRAIHGGLWVGGKAVLTATRLQFAANGVNRAVHQDGGSLQFDVPLGDIRHVRLRKAFITHIVDVETDAGTYSLRCWGADAFARTIGKAVASVR